MRCQEWSTADCCSVIAAAATVLTSGGMCLTQNYANRGIRCWSGNDDEAHAARHEFGAQGVISVTSNLLPGLYSRLMNSPNQELMDSLQALVAWLFCEPNPIGVNTAMVRNKFVQGMVTTLTPAWLDNQSWWAGRGHHMSYYNILHHDGANDDTFTDRMTDRLAKHFILTCG